MAGLIRPPVSRTAAFSNSPDRLAWSMVTTTVAETPPVSGRSFSVNDSINSHNACPIASGPGRRTALAPAPSVAFRCLAAAIAVNAFCNAPQWNEGITPVKCALPCPSS